ncbi:MAG TPA: transcriptional repressor LexA [Geminicoccaceae bacterium]|nr:transcriptional repressor LexA [Geminicoccaceae bacterium]
MLTQRQRQLLQFIQQYMNAHGVCPSFEEMRGALRLRSKSGIHRLISGLEERGYVRRLAYRARALEVVRAPADVAVEAAAILASLPRPSLERAPPASNIVHAPFKQKPRAAQPPLMGSIGSVDLPVYGRIAAGTPIEALADTSTTMDVPGALIGEGEHYLLQVTGDSMVDAGIYDGDMVVIRRCDTAENGAIVVALVDDREVTLKRLRRRGASIALEAANPDYETRIFGPHQVKVQGRLVGLIRRY